MPLKILPKKSWHVLSRDNIARVKKDEAEARALEAKKVEKTARAEQEARTALLRSRAQVKGGVDRRGAGQHAVPPGDGEAEGHINLFGQTSGAHNVEAEKERKEEHERAEQRMGVLTYLAQSTLGKDKKVSEPWYASRQDETQAASERQKQRKQTMDPLQVIQEARKRMRSHTQLAAPPPLSHSTSTSHKSVHSHAMEGTGHAKESLSEEPQSKRHKSIKEKHKKHKKHKSYKKRRKHKSPKKDTSSPVPAVAPSTGPSIEELRQERLKREKEEQRKTEALLRRAALAET